jgi:V8-like Glu-specific endopeptidase
MKARHALALVATAAACAATAVPAGAVTDGSLDGEDHPYVGIMVAKDDSGAPMWRCTGTLIAPQVFLTAGHCTFGADSVTVWFESDLQGRPELGYPFGGPTSVDGTPETHPDYDDAAFFLADLGVVILDDAVDRGGFGALPTTNRLDSLKPRASTTFTSVGYGLQEAYPDAADKDLALRTRYVANPHLVQINRGIVGDYAMILSNNARTGGTCFGDSGGPNFLGDSNVIAGVTSFGLNPACGGTGGVYRIDRAEELAWIRSFLG